jgi:ribonucleotide reductase alpha subunit
MNSKNLMLITSCLLSSVSGLHANIDLIEEVFTIDGGHLQKKSKFSFPGSFKLVDVSKGQRAFPREISLCEGEGLTQIQGDSYNYLFSATREAMEPFKGRTLTFTVDLKTQIPGAYIEYWDGGKEMKSAPHTGSGEWEILKVEFIVNTQNARWFVFYPAILPATDIPQMPVVEIKNILLKHTTIPSLQEILGNTQAKLVDTSKSRAQNRQLSFESIQGDYAGKIQGDSYNYLFSATREAMEPFKGRTLTFTVDLKTQTPGAYIEYWDGGKEMKSAPHTGSGEWETLKVEFIVNTQNARWFAFYPAILSAIENGVNPLVEFKNVSVVPVLPKHLLDDISPLLKLNLTLDESHNTSCPHGWLLTPNRGVKSPPIATRTVDGLKITGSGYNFHRPCAQLASYEDQYFVFSVNMKSNFSGAYIEYWDGLNEYKSTPHTGNGQWESLKVEFPIDAKKARFLMLYPAICPLSDNPVTLEIKDLDLHPKNKEAFDVITKQMVEEKLHKEEKVDAFLTKMYGAENELDEQPAGEISKFYLNQRKTPKSCLSLDDIYLMDWNELEFNHDYIQLIFPLKFKSESVPEAPTITLAEEAQFQKSKFLQKRVRANGFVDFY